MVVLCKAGMVEKILEWTGGRRSAAGLICIFGLMSCVGCAAAVSQSRSPLTGIPAAARARDYVATSEYLRARAQALRMTMAALPLNASLAEAVIAHARSECAGALRGTPATAAVNGRAATRQVVIAGMLNLEINGSILGRWARITDKVPLAASAAHTFAANVASLRWADPRIANLAHALVDVEAQLFAIPSINVCQAIHSWIASGYKRYPGDEDLLRPRGAVGRAWFRALLAVGCRSRVRPTQATLLAVLHPFERASSGPTTREIEKLETRVWAAFKAAERVHVEALWRALGLPALPRKRFDKRPITAPPPPDCMHMS
jgi:hypothetical protein